MLNWALSCISAKLSYSSDFNILVNGNFVSNNIICKKKLGGKKTTILRQNIKLTEIFVKFEPFNKSKAYLIL